MIAAHELFDNARLVVESIGGMQRVLPPMEALERRCAAIGRRAQALAGSVEALDDEKTAQAEARARVVWGRPKTPPAVARAVKVGAAPRSPARAPFRIPRMSQDG